MNVYLSACIQCYEKAADHLEKEVLPHVSDLQTRQGIQFCMQYAKQAAANIKQVEGEDEKQS